MKLIKCSKCKQDKEETAFWKQELTVYTYRSRMCKICRLRCNKNSRLKSLYGITLEQYETMLRIQANRCAICKNIMKKAFVDHDHLTHIVRQLLCFSCNTGLGKFNDDPALLEIAMNYILKH